MVKVTQEDDARFVELVREYPSLGAHEYALKRALSRHRQSAIAELCEGLEPFAKAAAGVAAFDPDYPMDGAALRASFDWYDKAQHEPLKRHSVRRSDLERAEALLSKHSPDAPGDGA